MEFVIGETGFEHMNWTEWIKRGFTG